ncbi:MAG: sigma-54 dependent transcriptional regulator [Acidobacteriota bacterium]
MSRVLIVEDDPKIRANLLFQLRDQGLSPTAMENAEGALAQLEGGNGSLPDLLLLDVRLPGMSGVDLVKQLAAIDRLPPTIILSGEASITETVDALQLGVHDFLEKPFSRERLMRSIENTLEHTALKKQVHDLERELAGEPKLLGDSPAMDRLRELIARAAATEARVLVQGESGTGKELVAAALHHQSSRRDRPFIKLNCAAIPSNLIEDELFGHVRGAYTDAKESRPGLFEEADGGTLFLDEIGDMDVQLQARLLRVLEDGKVRRIGDSRERSVDVRILAATHRDLEEAVRQQSFRQDLFFRLAHLPLEVPPLRQRGDDIRLLFDVFIEQYSRQHRLRPRRVDEQVYEQLGRYSWPGNVRELKHLCERLVVFGGKEITVDQLPTPLFASSPSAAAGAEGTDLLRLEAAGSLPLRELRARCEREYIEAMLRRSNWNISAAARALDLQRTYLHQKMATLGIRRPNNQD